LAIEVKDGGTPSLTAAADVIVTLQVTGVNDKDPEFTALPYTTTLAENLNFNGFVYGQYQVYCLWFYTNPRSTILETGTLNIILTMWFYKWRMHITES
jgi:hypothetical protein